MFYNNIVKISEKLNVERWKFGSKLPTLISAWFGFIFTMGKKEKIFDFLKTND